MGKISHGVQQGMLCEQEMEDYMAREVTRRGFVKLTSAAALGVAGMGAVSMSVPAAKALAESAPPEGMWVRTTCAPNCTGSCGVKAFV